MTSVAEKGGKEIRWKMTVAREGKTRRVVIKFGGT